MPTQRAATSPPSKPTASKLRLQHLRPAGERAGVDGPRAAPHRAASAATSSGRSASTRTCSGFPLTELIENRDYPGSTHFFFDIGNGNLLAFFDFPGPGRRPVRRGARRAAPHGDLGRARPLAARSWSGSRQAGVEHEVHSGVSVYFRDPDGARIELIADPLGEMYGTEVL